MKHIFIFIFIVSVFFLSKSNLSEVNAQTTTNPTFNCLGSCPPSSPAMQPSKQIQRGIAPAIAPSTTQPSSFPLPTETTPLPSLAPCEAETVSVQRSNKKKHVKKKKGAINRGVEQLLRFFLEFINLLLRLIGGGPLPIPPANPCDIPSPIPTTAPSETPPSSVPSNSPVPSATPVGSAGCGQQIIAGTSKNTITVNGVQRTYLLIVPTGLETNKPVPLIFGFHGGSDTAENANQYMGLNNNDPILSVYPQAPYWQEAGGIGWNVDPAGVDFPYFDAMLSELKQKHCIDTTRIFATGKSNGAFFINALACHRPGVLKGIAPVAGGGPAAQCAQKESIAAMFVHGVADQPVPIDTGRASRDYWLGANGYTAGTPTTTIPSQCVSYPGTSKPTLWCEHAGGHDWPTWAGTTIRNFFLNL